MSNKKRVTLNELRSLVKKIINEKLSSSVEKEVILYHRLNNKGSLDTTNFIKSVINNGLIRHDNGEVGNVIWFSDTFNDYSNNGKFVVSIPYNEVTRNKYDIYYDNHNGYAYADIPFDELTVIKIPVFVHSGRVISSDEMIKLINNKVATIQNTNGLINLTIYGDLFNEYVQPYIDIDNFLDKLDTNTIKIINIK